MEVGWWRKPKIFKEKIFNKNYNMTDTEKKGILKTIEETKEKISLYQEDLLILGEILDLNVLKEKGFSIRQLEKFYEEDKTTIENAKKHLQDQKTNERDYMFGYSANMTNESSVVSYFRWIESQLFYTNSCGTPYSSGNYRMSQQKTELEIISRFVNYLGLNSKKYWGYITSGGTEGNLWGIREGFSKFPNGKLYFSQDAHYSALKGTNFLPNINYEVISSNKGIINKEELLNNILEFSKEDNKGVVVFLTFGTTTFGSVDDIRWIIKRLIEKNIAHYIHLDAALYGGIPYNQNNSPSRILKKLMDMEIDSLSVSLHKYIGLPKTNGILLSKSQINKQFIEYIGNSDVTLCGSRDFLPHTTLQKIKENYERSNSNDYIKNIIYFEQKLNENGIVFEKGIKNGNIFVIPKPSNEICYKYQLTTFKFNKKDKAHVIIFPFHKKEIIEQLVNDLKKDYENSNIIQHNEKSKEVKL